MKTDPVCKQRDVEQMTSLGFTPKTIQAVLHIRSLDDKTLLNAARREGGSDHGAIVSWMSRDGQWTNPSWVTGACAEEAYDRGLIDEQELDWITR